jgi:hypothetical protein
MAAAIKVWAPNNRVGCPDRALNNVWRIGRRSGASIGKALRARAFDDRPVGEVRLAELLTA